MPSPRQSPGNTSTVSSFQPEFESTQQFDTATQSLQLPNLRSSAQRFSYYNPPQPAMHIDSSFVRDSFPDFTEKSPSPSPEVSMSIEAGRGKKGSPKSFDISDIPLPSDSLYELHSTPPRSARPTPKKADSLRKEASLRRAHSSDKRANASQRRSLSDMHHKVHRESESSFVGEDRPATQTVQPRNTRFTSANLPTSYSHDRGLQSMGTPQRPIQNPTATWTGGTQTQASFMLPDLPNITELVSGVRKDGTPVFSRSQKSRSRFTSASHNNPTITNTITHANINSIAVPDEEKAIFASLQLLKDKVAHLETEKSEAQKRLEEYETEVGHLKSRLDIEQKLRRPDSALGEDDDGSAKEKWRVERATLQSTVKTLRDCLDRGERKLSVNDIAVKRLTQERDDLVTQLGVAYYNSEEFRSENLQLRESNEHLEADVEVLQAENGRLRVRLAQIKAQFNDETHQWNSRESDLKAKIQRREAAVREMQHDLTVQSAPAQDQTSRSTKSRIVQDDQQSSNKRRPSGRIGQDTKHNILDSIENEIKRSRSGAMPANIRSRSRSKSNTRQTASKSQRIVDVSDVDSTTNLDFSRPIRDDTVEAEEDSKDITYLSFLDPRELAKLRKTLEEERRASRTARVVSAPAAPENATSTMTAVPRKSSLRDVTNNDTGRFTIRSQVDENTGLLKNVRIQSPHMSDAISYSEPRESTEASFVSTSSRRRNRSKSVQEMTSAFILPDITLHTGPGAEATLANATIEISHDDLNCTACPSKDSHDKDITIPTPIPVSSRDIDDTNATIRPSQPPPIALATVLKQLEDEVKHLKFQFSSYDKMYNQHDPALGRRKRLAVKAKISTLMAEIERRSDQIYSLYDVLEGQKSSAAETDAQQQEMDEEQVEETLQSLGIDVEELGQRAQEMQQQQQQQQQHPFDLDREVDESEEDDLPWGGFSDESEVEEVVLPTRQRRSSSGSVVNKGISA